jgi:hypothetical protein
MMASEGVKGPGGALAGRAPAEPNERSATETMRAWLVGRLERQKKEIRWSSFFLLLMFPSYIDHNFSSSRFAPLAVLTSGNPVRAALDMSTLAKLSTESYPLAFSVFSLAAPFHICG